MSLGLLDPNRIEVYGDCQFGPSCSPKGREKVKSNASTITKAATLGFRGQGRGLGTKAPFQQAPKAQTEEA